VSEASRRKEKEINRDETAEGGNNLPDLQDFAQQENKD